MDDIVKNLDFEDFGASVAPVVDTDRYYVAGTFPALCIRDILRLARIEGVSQNTGHSEPAFDEENFGLQVDDMSDIRDGLMDKAERGFLAAAERAMKSVADEAAARAADPPAPQPEPTPTE